MLARSNFNECTATQPARQTNSCNTRTHKYAQIEHKYLRGIHSDKQLWMNKRKHENAICVVFLCGMVFPPTCSDTLSHASRQDPNKIQTFILGSRKRFNNAHISPSNHLETPNFQRGTIDCISQGKVEDKVKPYKAADKVEKSYKVVDKVKGREILQDQIEPLAG